MVSRPSEAISAVVGSIVGAVLIILGAFTDYEVTAEVQGAIVVLVSWIAAGVTWFIAKRQRAGTLESGADGTVSST